MGIFEKYPLLLCFLALSSLYVQETAPGEFTVQVSIDIIDQRLNVATAEAIVEATVVGGDGDVYISLPFSPSTNGRILVEPSPTCGLATIGNLGPIRRITVIEIDRCDTDIQLEFTFTEVLVPLGDSAQSRSGKVLLLQFGNALTQLRDTIGPVTSLRLSNVILESEEVEFSEPLGVRTSLDSGYVIDFDSDESTPADITYFLAGSQNRALAFIIPLVIGAPLGFLAGLQVIRSRRWAWVALIGSVIILILAVVGIVAAYWLLADYIDTGIVLALGTLVGALIGLILISIHFLRVQPSDIGQLLGGQLVEGQSPENAPVKEVAEISPADQQDA